MKILAFLFAMLISLSQADWVSQSSGTSLTLNAVYFLNARTGWIGGDSGFVSKTSDSGKTWQIQNWGNPGNIRHIRFINDGLGWFVANGAAIYKTVNGGLNWSLRSNDTSLFIKHVQFLGGDTVWATSLKPEGDTAVLAVVKTTDAGVYWSDDFRKHVFAGITEYSSVYFVNSRIGWRFGGQSSSTIGQYWDFNVEKTTDGGATWTTQKILGGGIYPFIAGYFLNADTGWLVGGARTHRTPQKQADYYQTNAEIIKTTDGGDSWSIQADYFEHDHFYVFQSVQFTSPLNGWVIGDEGSLYRTTDGGATWLDTHGGLSPNLREGYFLAQSQWTVGSEGSLWKFDPSVVPIRADVPRERASLSAMLLGLEFSGNSAHIRIHISNSEPNVSLSLVNIRGRMVASTNKSLGAGNGEIVLDASSLPLGVYYCTVRTAHAVETRRFIRMHD